MKKNLLITIAWIIVSIQPLLSQKTDVNLTAEIERAIDSIEPPIPVIEPLFSFHLRDVEVCKGPGKSYYLTGTTDDNWGVADGIRVWKSNDLKNWEIIGEDEFVWRFDKDASNKKQKEIIVRKGRKIRGIWAPEIHYIKNNFWITYSISNGYGSGLLRSTTGKPEGPYEDIKKDGPLVNGIDATLFEDNNSVWYIWGPGKMKRLNKDMSGFENDDPPLYPKDASGKNVGYEGVNMYKKNGIYYLMAAEWNTEGPRNGHLIRNTNVNRRAADGRYDCMIAMSDNLTGPYSDAYIAISHGGHNNIFDDFEGNTWATMFGNDEAAAQFREMPAILRMKLNEKNELIPVLPFPFHANDNMPVIFVSDKGDNSKGKSWKTAFLSLQDAIEAAKPGTQIWVKEGLYPGGIKIINKKGLYIYGGFKGNEINLSDRPTKIQQSVLDGNSVTRHVVKISGSEYIRMDGFIIREGNAMGPGHKGNGGGIWLSGGGESIRFGNCSIENNYAAKNGAGLFAINGASPLFTNCNFYKNESLENGGAAYIECNSSNGYHTRFYHCHFKENRSLLNGAVAYFRTDLKQTGTLRFINCLIEKNFTLLEQGNIVLKGGATLLMTQCTVVGNKGMSKGASVLTLGQVPAQNRIVNSIFYDNYGATLINADAFEGTDPTSGRHQNWTQLLNCLIYNNQTLGIAGYTYKLDRFDSVEEINKSAWGDNNISEKPQFISEESGNYKLSPNSPAINNGTASNAFPIDIDGNYRTINMDKLHHSVDIGFDEFDKD